jgi:hypothetical protein
MLQKGRTRETAIFAKSERRPKIDKSGSRRSDNSSKYNVERPVHLLFDQHQSSGDSQGTNRIPIPTSETTVKMDNAPRKKSYMFYMMMKLKDLLFFMVLIMFAPCFHVIIQFSGYKTLLVLSTCGLVQMTG